MSFDAHVSVRTTARSELRLDGSAFTAPLE